MEPQATDAPPDRPELGDQPPTAPARPGRPWAAALLAATLAGVVAWLVGEKTLNHFIPPEKLVQAMGQTLNAPSFEDRMAAQRKNASLANGVLGCALGLALGLAGGLSRRSPRAALAAGIAGSLVGLGVGVGASEVILPFYFRQVDRAPEELSRDLMLPLLIHGGIWSAIGGAAGASLGLGLGLGLNTRLASAALAGLIGGALGAGVYEIIGAMAFPAGLTTDPLANDWAPRLIGKLAVAMMSAGLAAFAISSTDAKKPAKS